MKIYKATNKINNKCYIGQTKTTLKVRISNHKRCKNTYFSKAIQKYGIENFRWTILEICMDQDDLNEKEKYYISLFDSINQDKGYNLTTGGECFEMSEQTKQKMRKPKPDKTNYKGGTHNKGKTPWNKGLKGVVKDSEETKIKKVLSHKGKHYHIGQIPWNKGKKGVQVAWNKGLKKKDYPDDKDKH